ncbi:hypothetical protein IFU40_11495 [Microbacterium sp. CFBP 13617]|uniref:hypothetical protein n=1 Tax=Microbacterium sp. CFBP 13617 TaxID=2774035 RepID=UPI00177C73D6|nr:hypothetical protein [Microbacterium sp. CFBP 13617]MBD8219259.1 hypothetical protein [Microbacterium sp. CFBP 13617]
MSPEPAVSPIDVAHARFRLAVDELAASIVGDDEASILSRVNSAGSALYALWLFQGVSGGRQVAWAGEDAERRNVVGLVYARGEAEHQQRHLAMAAGFGEAPFGLGPFGGGWLWSECPASRPSYGESQALYDEQVLWKSLPDPFERAAAWLGANPPR